MSKDQGVGASPGRDAGMEGLIQAFGAFFSALPEAVSLKDLQLRFLAVNPAMCTHLGLAEREVLGRTVSEAGIGGHEALEKMERGVLAPRGEESGRGIVAPLPDGVGSFASISPVFDAQGRAVAVLSRLVDPADFNALGREPARERDMSLAKSSFLANVSHEVRTSLTGIMGMTDLALNTPLSTEQRDYLSMVRQSADVLHDLLDDILDLSKIEAGKLELAHEALDVAGAVDHVLRSSQALARSKELTLESHVRADVPRYIRGDAKRLMQVLLNLVNNAVKFTNQGKVDVEVALADPAECGKQGKECVRFSVRDTGMGIPEHMQPGLFTPYSRVPMAQGDHGKGFGLGLAISRQLVEEMGGRIWLWSRPGQGSVFHFTLPLDAVTEQEVVAQSGASLEKRDMSAGNGAGEGIRILLAEDNDVNRLFALNVLRNKGYEVHAVTNGREVLEVLPTMHFDLVLMDVQMPAMDGIEATKAMRADTSGAFDPDIPIIALTAHAMRGDKERFLAAGMNEYIAKPLCIEELCGVIDKVLERGTVQAEPPKSVAPSEEGQEPVVDISKTLARLKGDREFLAELHVTFLEDMEQRMDRFTQALEQGDATGLQKLAHSLKGAASTIDAGKLREQAYAMELAAKDEDMAKAGTEFIALKTCLAELTATLEQWRKDELA